MGADKNNADRIGPWTPRTQLNSAATARVRVSLTRSCARFAQLGIAARCVRMCVCVCVCGSAVDTRGLKTVHYMSGPGVKYWRQLTGNILSEVRAHGGRRTLFGCGTSAAVIVNRPHCFRLC